MRGLGGGVADLFGDEIDRALEAAQAFRDARQRVVSALALEPAERPPLARGLARWIAYERVEQGYRPPRGWALQRMDDRRAYVELPLWLAYVRTAWRWRWWLVEKLLDVGILDVDEGDYYHNARPRCPSWLWCFLHDQDRDPRGRRVLGTWAPAAASKLLRALLAATRPGGRVMVHPDTWRQLEAAARAQRVFLGGLPIVVNKWIPSGQIFTLAGAEPSSDAADALAYAMATLPRSLTR